MSTSWFTRLALCALLALGCSGSVRDDGDDGTSSRRDAGPRLTDGGSSCRPACEEGYACVEGLCVPATCEEGMKQCGLLCVDTSSSTAHCGDCFQTCTSEGDATAVCAGGACRQHCWAEPATTFCDDGKQCSNGRCCPSGQTWCENAGGCVNTATDPLHCGSCDNACSETTNGSAACTDSQCGTSCQQGYTSCDGTCVNLSNDPDYCGSCFKSCPSGMCASQKCVTASENCTIDAAEAWPSCNGAWVNSGQTVKITASGTWSMIGDTSKSCGPGGYASNPAPSNNNRLDSKYPFGSLLYGVGVVGGPNSAVGSFTTSSNSVTWVAGKKGYVVLQINDSDVTNNTGSMNVQITVSDP
jgi:hypothetical protein